MANIQNTTDAIERVADKRHARLMEFMCESDASQRVVQWLAHLENHWSNMPIWVSNKPSILNFIAVLKSGYQS